MLAAHQRGAMQVHETLGYDGMQDPRLTVGRTTAEFLAQQREVIRGEWPGERTGETFDVRIGHRGERVPAAHFSASLSECGLTASRPAMTVGITNRSSGGARKMKGAGSPVSIHRSA